MNLVVRLLWAVLAFVATYVVLLIVAAILNAVGVADAADVVQRFAWIVSLLVAIVAFLSGWNPTAPRR